MTVAIHRFFDLLLGLIFIGVLVTPVVRMVTRGEEAQSAHDQALLAEQRSPASLPEWPKSFDEMRRIPSTTKDWFDDAFGFRRELVRANGILKIEGFGKSPSDRLLMGPKGWLFNTESGVVEAHLGLNLFSDAVVDEWCRTFEQRREILARRGIPYVFTWVPDKHTVYKDQLPAKFSPSRVRKTRFEDLMERVLAKTEAPPLDLRAPLLAARSQGLVYWKYGTHWTPLGAHVGYDEVFSKFEGFLPELQPRPLKGWILLETPPPGDHLGARVLVADRLPQESTHVMPHPAANFAVEQWVENGVRIMKTVIASRPELPKALVFHDSFAQSWLNVFAPHFSEVTYVWRGEFDMAMVDRCEPDLVIHEMVERFSSHGPRYTLDPVPLAPEADLPLGFYHHPLHPPLRVHRHRDGLLVRFGSRRMIMRRASGSTFVPVKNDIAAQMEVRRNAKGDVDNIGIRWGDEAHEFVPAPGQRPLADAEKDKVGHYEGAGVAYVVAAAQGLALYDHQGVYRGRLTKSAEGQWRVPRLPENTLVFRQEMGIRQLLVKLGEAIVVTMERKHASPFESRLAPLGLGSLQYLPSSPISAESLVESGR